MQLQHINPTIFPNYLASDEGKVFCRKPNGSLKELKPTPRSKGKYLCVTLCGPLGHTLLPIHKAICMAFHGDSPFEGAIVRHLDDDLMNNSADNLAWGSHKDNAEDRVKNGRQVRGADQRHAKLNVEQVLSLVSDYSTGLFNQKQLADKYQISVTGVSLIILGKSWKHVDRVRPNSREVQSKRMLGAGNPSAKLTSEQFEEAFRLREEKGLSYRAIGKLFGVSGTSIHRAYRNRKKLL